MLNRLEMLRLFCAAAEASSFKEAAARLGTSPQAITRAVKELEEAVGELLFHRNTRGVQITEFGAQLAVHARDGVSHIDNLFHKHSRLPDAGLTGVVRITAPRVIGRRYLMKALLPLATRHPGIRLDVQLTDVVADVVDERIDIGVRIGQLRDSRFVARAIAKMPFVVVGTPKLAAAKGKPATPQDLQHLPMTALTDHNTGRIWPWFFADNHNLVPATPAFVSDDPEVEFSAMLADIGYGQVLAQMAEPYLRSGKLISVLDDYQPPPWDLYIYRPRRGPVPARIRLVYDHIVEALSDPVTFNEFRAMTH